MSEREKAKQYALRLLAARPYASHRLRSKMLEKGYAEEIVSEWIEWLKKVDLLEDDALLASLIERELRRGVGPKAILWKLRGKGFSSEEIVRKMAQIASPDRQRDAMRAWVRKKGGDVRARANELIRRGFDSDLVLQEFL